MHRGAQSILKAVNLFCQFEIYIFQLHVLPRFHNFISVIAFESINQKFIKKILPPSNLSQTNIKPHATLEPTKSS